MGSITIRTMLGGMSTANVHKALLQSIWKFEGSFVKNKIGTLSSKRTRTIDSELLGGVLSD